MTDLQTTTHSTQTLTEHLRAKSQAWAAKRSSMPLVKEDELTHVKTVAEILAYCEACLQGSGTSTRPP